jgi:VCBS repeat-containing protein
MTFATKGFAQPFAAIGREIFIKNFDLGAAMSQADLQALVEAVQLTSSIVAIGAFTAGTSESVSMIIDGKDVTAVAGYTVTDVAF